MTLVMRMSVARMPSGSGKSSTRSRSCLCSYGKEISNEVGTNKNCFTPKFHHRIRAGSFGGIGLHILIFFVIVLCFGCGDRSSGGGTTQMGGAIQGMPLNLSAIVTTLAGTAGQTGSIDATGSAARFYHPGGVTTDGTNLYVADSNDTIRKTVIATGEVTTPAGLAYDYGSADGTGSAARFNMPWGITTDGKSLYVGDKSNYTIRKIR